MKLRTVPSMMWVLALSLGVPAQSASAQQAYPTKPITMVVTLGPGSLPDVAARVLAERMQSSLGKPVIVENRPGADGLVGTEYVSKTAPDGYTLLYALGGSLTVVPALYGNRVRYDSEKDFAPITQTVRTTIFVTANKSFAPNDLKQLGAYAKANGRSLVYGHTAGVVYLMALLLKQETSSDVELAPYKGNPELVTDLLTGRVQVGLSSLVATQQQIKAGKLKALAVLSESRSGVMPEVPTSAEQGYADLAGDTWNGVLARAGTAPAIVEKLYREIVRIHAQPDVRDRLLAAGIETKTSDPESLARLIHEDKARFGKMVREFQITADR